MKIIENTTPAGPHELGESLIPLGESFITIALTHEEFNAFYAALEKAEADESPKPKLEAMMKRKAPWDE